MFGNDGTDRPVSRNFFAPKTLSVPFRKKFGATGRPVWKKKAFNDVGPAEDGKFSSKFRAFFENLEKRKNERFQLGGARWRLKILKNFDWKFSLNFKAIFENFEKVQKKNVWFDWKFSKFSLKFKAIFENFEKEQQQKKRLIWLEIFFKI